MSDVNLALTTAGQALKAKIEAGSGNVALHITRIVTGSGTSGNPLNLTAVVNEKQQFAITGRQTIGGSTNITALLTNTGNAATGEGPLAQGYPLTQIGFYALDPDLGEILYRISQFTSPKYVPAASESSWTYEPTFSIVTGNASEVTIQVNPADIATKQDVQAANEAATAAQTTANAKAPVPHNSPNATYGVGTATDYGHVRLTDAASATDASAGVAATPAAVKVAYDAAVTAQNTAYASQNVAYAANNTAGNALTELNNKVDLSLIGTPGGVASLDSTGLVPLAQLPADIGSGGEGGGMSTFVYECTGTTDSTAIANIVNDFFNNGTAMSMKLIVTGIMGLQYTNILGINDTAINITATNSRGAKCYIDFSDCNIPTVVNGGRVAHFIYVSVSGPQFVISGLNVNVSGGNGIHFNDGGSNNTINDSVITANSGVYVLSTSASNNNIFNNCTFNSSKSYPIYLNSPNITNYKFNNCIFNSIGSSASQMAGVQLFGSGHSFVNCIFTGKNTGNGGAYGVSSFSGTTNCNFVNCVILGNGTSSYSGGVINGSSFNFVNCIITNDSNLTSGNSIANLLGYSGLFNCIITSPNAGNGILVSDNTSSNIVLNKCKVTAFDTGISVTTSNIGTVIKLKNCLINGETNDINQTSAVATVNWNIIGCSFNKSSIHVNGSDLNATSNTAISYAYIPAYGNFFSKTIT